MTVLSWIVRVIAVIIIVTVLGAFTKGVVESIKKDQSLQKSWDKPIKKSKKKAYKAAKKIHG